MELMKQRNAFFRLLDDAAVYYRTVSKLEYDMQCTAPQEGMERAADDMAIVAQNIHRIEHSKRYITLLTALYEHRDELEELDRRAVCVRYEAYEKNKNISSAFALEMDTIRSRAFGSWLAAKEANDFSLFRDALQSIVAITRKEIELRENHPEKPYDACLDDNEKDGSSKQLDDFFARLREGILPLVKQIRAKGRSLRDDFLSRPCPIPQQEAFSRYLLELEGLRPTALVLDTSEHPFTENFGRRDVRVTTHYYEDLFLSNIFTTLHEGGHALFMQNEPECFEAHHTDNLMSNGMHECISRFYENLIGRSEAFIHFIYPKLCEFCPDVMEGVSERELYEGVNIACPSLVRTEADELTYCLHIMVRYEIERDLVNGRCTADEVPSLWKEKYKEYLGIEVPDDVQGCLQDVHWSAGFGYFPSYALGNAYGVQILRRMEKDFDVWDAVSRGELTLLRDWLAEHVFSKASLLSPNEWIIAVTGEKLNPDYYLSYLKEKYSRLYELKVD